MPAWLAPLLIQAGSMAASKLMEPKRPGAFTYPGMEGDEDLANAMRGYIGSLLPTLTNTGGYQAGLDRRTARTFARERAGAKEDAAIRGITRSSWDSGNTARLAVAENEAMTDNVGAAQGLRNQNAGFMSSLLSGMGMLRQPGVDAARLNYGAEMDNYNQGLSTAESIGQIGTGAAVGAALAPDDVSRWKAAIAGGLAPGYMEYLFNQQPGAAGMLPAGKMIPAGNMTERFGGVGGYEPYGPVKKSRSPWR